jgi:hypothetical protein
MVHGLSADILRCNWPVCGLTPHLCERHIEMTNGRSKNSGLQFLQVALLLLPLILTTPSRAYGYTDPGSGMFIYQAAYAAFLGGTFYLRKILDKIFGKRRR